MISAAATTEQQATAEPKKYMGSSIPSRSFRMLQAMTGADDGKVAASLCKQMSLALSTSFVTSTDTAQFYSKPLRKNYRNYHKGMMDILSFQRQ